jgi:predicted phosphate transport protein (TIGR00153 family)
MLTIARLFGRSPFAPLQTHMNLVTHCMEKLKELIKLLPDTHKFDKLISPLTKWEQEADVMKNDIRNHLPKKFLLPIDRSHFLDILSIQDSIADQAEEIALALKLRPLSSHPNLIKNLQELFHKSFETFLSTRQIISELDLLLESSFGGIEAEKVKALVEDTALKESQTKVIQRSLLSQLFVQGETFSTPDFFLFAKLIEDIGNLAFTAERLANRIRMVLELK